MRSYLLECHLFFNLILCGTETDNESRKKNCEKRTTQASIHSLKHYFNNTLLPINPFVSFATFQREICLSNHTSHASTPFADALLSCSFRLLTLSLFPSVVT